MKHSPTRKDLNAQNPNLEFQKPKTKAVLLGAVGPFTNTSPHSNYECTLEIFDTKEVFERIVFNKEGSIFKIGQIVPVSIAVYNEERFLVLKNENIEVAFRWRKTW